jgi:hypothetical protein
MMTAVPDPRLLRMPHQSPNLAAQLDMPVGKIDKMPPTLMRLMIEGDVKEGLPARALRLPLEPHAGFVRKLVGLL